MPLRATPPSLLCHLTTYTMPQTSDVGCSINPFSRLPNETLLHIFSFLDADQLLVCGQVCRRWRRLSLDWHLWQVKLFETRWCTIVCPEPPPRDMPIPLPKSPFHDPSSIHPRTVYRFLSQYIPKCDGGDSGSGELDDTSSPPSTPSTVPEVHTSHLSAFIHSIIYHVRSLLPSRNSSPANASTAGASPNRPRFALFGPGLDHRWTSRLFWKMVDTHTRSFEPINVFTGHMGFESGITLRLFAQAQHAVMDGSTRCSSSTRKTSCDSPKPSNTSTMSRFTSCLSASAVPPMRSAETESASPPLVHHSTEYPCQCHQHEDFTFDLSYLYSLPPHLKHVFNDQYTRLRVSRLFFHQQGVEREEEREIAPEMLLSHLEVTHEMREICRKLDGLIYAIDARESAEQLTLLYHELRAVLRAFPERTGRRIPLVVLYIMPKEDIKFQKTAAASTSAALPPVVSKPELVNRDSYSGAEYTAAWHDSILLVISALKLFELPNPWRLQKCSSNDIKTLIQSLMWLNLKYLRPVAVSMAEE
ncbi:Cyclin F box [Echinococcus multilocularis]|uniref:Cyclin F box n=1 Tax=Echinococcus multilocularis TaxID=6211 RepID=A0A068XZR9_ECHMU|nr:Cyclin F box [Echinococcus multilocularis]